MRLFKGQLYKSLRGFELALLALAILSLAILFLPKDWLTRTYTLDPRSYPARVAADSKGESEVAWIDEERQAWECTLDLNYSSSFCSLTISVLDEHWHGIDLSRFTSMTIHADYKGKAETIRVYLRNRHPRYYRTGDEVSTKYNLVEIPISYLVNGTSFELNGFSVADWWLSSRKIPLKYASPEFTDIIFIEIQTGTFHKSLHNKFQIREISWEGRLISDEQAYRGLAILWVLVILTFIVHRLLQIGREVKKNRRYQDELVSINKLLNFQNKQFEELAKTDPLTGVLNRIGIREVLIEGLQAWKEKQVPFSLILIDLDHFKQVNDVHGHDMGDETLIAAAELFQQNLGDNTFVARWGGEEFLVACNYTNLKQAQKLAEELRRDLEQAKLDSGIKITASFGVATLRSSTLSELFKNADAALYQAKNSGRNQVVVDGQFEDLNKTG